MSQLVGERPVQLVERDRAADADLVTLRLAPEVTFSVLMPDSDGALAAAPVGEDVIRALFDGTYEGDVYGITPEFMPFQVLTIGGRVVSIDQLYLP